MVDLLALTVSPIGATFSFMLSPGIVAIIRSVVPSMAQKNMTTAHSEAMPTLAWLGKNAAEMWCRHDG